MDEQLLNNRYRLLAPIASGGMAIVYKAHDTLLNRVVAIKVLRQRFAQDPHFLDRFRQEAQAAANLSHPNIVTIYDIGSDAKMPPAGETWHYIVMEYVEGRNLKDWIQESAPFPIASAVEIALQICAGVGHAHRHGLVHCDLKPQNVLITQEGVVKVTDFGIARAYAAIAPEETDTVWGTPHYFAPEQAAGEPPTPASDVYSIGVILYEMLTGRLPFQAKDAHTLALMHLQEPPPPPHQFNPQIPPQLEQIVLKVLSKEPSARYRTAEQLRRILHRYREEGEGATSFYTPVSAYPPASVSAVGAEREAPAGYAQPYEYDEGVAEPYAAASGPDWLAWFLSVVAVLMVLGLIPLWAVVYRSYQALGQPPVPTPTLHPTVTAPPGQAVVPYLIGLEMPQAQAEVERAGLTLAVEEEREDPNHPRPVVLEQDPPAGAVVVQGSTVSVVASKALESPPVPAGLLGLTFNEEIKAGLESYGWRIVTEEEWSREPKGRILAVEPPEGTPLPVGSTLTLTLSSGAEVLLEVNLGDMVNLLSAELNGDRFQPGDLVAVTLRWQARKPVDQSYTAFFHLIGPDGQLVAQDDRIASDPRTWTPGVIVPDTHAVVLPADAPPGTYQLRTGLYLQATMSRLPVVDSGRTTAEEDSILIREIEVGP